MDFKFGKKQSNNLIQHCLMSFSQSYDELPITALAVKNANGMKRIIVTISEILNYRTSALLNIKLFLIPLQFQSMVGYQNDKGSSLKSSLASPNILKMTNFVSRKLTKEVFFKIGFRKSFPIFTGKHSCWILFLKSLFSRVKSQKN